MIVGLLDIQPYPPFLYIISAFAGSIFGYTIDGLVALNSVFVGITVLSIYGIGAKPGNPQIGICGALIFLLYPSTYGIAHFFLIETLLTTVVTLTILCLLPDEEGMPFRHSIRLGMCLGVGLLTKWTFGIFIVGPFLVVCFQNSDKRIIRQLARTFSVGALIAAPWYLYNIRPLLMFWQRQGLSAIAEGDSVISPSASWWYYIETLIEQQMLPVFVAFLALSIFVLLKTRESSTFMQILVVWILIPYLLFTYHLNKDLRYVVPMLPAIALLMGMGMAKIPFFYLRLGVYSVLILYGTTLFIELNVIGRQIPFLNDIPQDRFYPETLYYASPPCSDYWQQQEILADVVRSEQEQGLNRSPRLAIVPNTNFFESNSFQYYAVLEEIPIEVIGISGVALNYDQQSQIAVSDYVITKSGVQGLTWAIGNANTLASDLSDNKTTMGALFDLIKIYTLPSGESAFLYRRIPSSRR